MSLLSECACKKQAAAGGKYWIATQGIALLDFFIIKPIHRERREREELLSKTEANLLSESEREMKVPSLFSCVCCSCSLCALFPF
jgi:hypothetical protein